MSNNTEGVNEYEEAFKYLKKLGWINGNATTKQIRLNYTFKELFHRLKEKLYDSVFFQLDNREDEDAKSTEDELTDFETAIITSKAYFIALLAAYRDLLNFIDRESISIGDDHKRVAVLLKDLVPDITSDEDNRFFKEYIGSAYKRTINGITGEELLKDEDESLGEVLLDAIKKGTAYTAPCDLSQYQTKRITREADDDGEILGKPEAEIEAGECYNTISETVKKFQDYVNSARDNSAEEIEIS